MDGDAATGKTQEFSMIDLGPPAEVMFQPPAGLSAEALAAFQQHGSAAALRQDRHRAVTRLADPALGATPRKVHRLRDVDPWHRLIPWLAVIILVICVIAGIGVLALEYHAWRMIGG